MIDSAMDSGQGIKNADKMDDFTIALTDDDDDEHIIFADALSMMDDHIHLLSFRNGKDLLEDLNTSSTLPNIVFIDINMPQQDGFETVSAIRALERFKELPVVMYSTSTNRHDVIKSYDLGANLYLRKEVAEHSLISNLKIILSIFKQHNGWKKPELEKAIGYCRF
jgi:PleD family two-component response regulator